MQESLELFDGFWLPVPFFRYKSDSQFDRGPKNWARLRFVKLAQADANGNTHRLTLAFDTRTRARMTPVTTSSPTMKTWKPAPCSVLPSICTKWSGSWTSRSGLSNG